jgi:hypothetical protein
MKLLARAGPFRDVGRTSKEDRRKLRPLPRSADTSGLTAGYGVIVRRDCANNLRLLTHELVHVAPYERLGREGFLQEYIHKSPHKDT